MQQVAWVPSAFAREGLTVKVQNDDDSWDPGWQVAARYTTLPTTTVKERSRDCERTRKASDR